VPAIPVYHYVRTHLVKPWVGGFTPDKLGYYFTKDMYIKKH
jgi:oligopeptide transport system substrate-binding protein